MIPRRKFLPMGERVYSRSALPRLKARVLLIDKENSPSAADNLTILIARPSGF